MNETEKKIRTQNTNKHKQTQCHNFILFHFSIDFATIPTKKNK